MPIDYPVKCRYFPDGCYSAEEMSQAVGPNPTLFALLSMAGLLGVAGCSWGIGRAADTFGLQAGLTLLILPVLAGLAACAALPRSGGSQPIDH